MVDFSKSQPVNIASKLLRALDGKRPFAHFKDAVRFMDIQDMWYSFIDKWYEEQAEKWLTFTETDFKDGRIVTESATITWDGEY